MLKLFKNGASFVGLLILSLNICASELDPQWNSLLYNDHGSNIISDPKFYIDSKKQDPSDELKKVISILESNENSELICRFPARFYWANQKFGIRSKVSFDHCPDLNTFLKKAPAEKISVVFASENIAVPSSMMGHIYIKLDGNNGVRDVSHLISYFTDSADGNIFKLIYETVFVGKEGHYALLPGRSLTENYLSSEGRNIWSYEIQLSPFQRKLIHLHLYELKDIKLKYFFHKFNCATLVYRILKVAYPKSEEINRPWVTPLDVVRSSYNSSIISAQSVELSDSWKIKALIFSNSVSSDKIDKIKKLNLELNSTTFQDRELYRSYLSFLQANDDKNPKINQEIQKLDLIESDKGKGLDLTLYKNPVNTKSNAFFSIGYKQFDKHRYGTIDFMPASHMIEDDSSQYLNHSELQISKVSLEFELKKARLKEYSLYSSTMLIPSDKLTGGLSSDYGVGYFSFVDSKLDEVSRISARGKIGKTYRLHRDLDFYLLSGVRLDSEFEFTPVLDVGFVLNSIFNSKLVLSVKDEFYSRHSFNQVRSANLKLGVDLGDYMLILNSNAFNDLNTTKLNFGLDFKAYF